jgi:L-threonylcarbamoyladenylate synthase
MLKSHYAPGTPLLLHDEAGMLLLPCEQNTGYLFFSGKSRRAWLARQPQPAGQGRAETPEIRALSETGGLADAAANLFSALHRMDALGLLRIHAERAPGAGLGRAINDRLERASC